MTQVNVVLWNGILLLSEQTKNETLLRNGEQGVDKTTGNTFSEKKEERENRQKKIEEQAC